MKNWDSAASKPMEFQHQHIGDFTVRKPMGISNEIHVQVASILLAACFDDIDLVKRNVNGQEIPGKSSFLIDGVGEISGRHRLSG